MGFLVWSQAFAVRYNDSLCNDSPCYNTGSQKGGEWAIFACLPLTEGLYRPPKQTKQGGK